MARKKKEPVEVEEVLPEIEETEEPVFQYEPPPIVKKQLSENVEIIPLRDFKPGIHHNEIHIDNIKAGVPVTIPRQFLQNMVTEKVINKIPK